MTAQQTFTYTKSAIDKMDTGVKHIPKFTIKTPKRRQQDCYVVFDIN